MILYDDALSYKCLIHSIDNVVALTKTKRDINAITGFVRKQGNGAHVICPKEWIGIEVIVRPLIKEQEEHAEKSIAGIKRRKKF